MELSEYRGIKFNLNLNRYGTGNPEKFYAKIFLECSLTSLCIFFYSDIFGALLSTQFGLEKCSPRLSSNVGILNNKFFLLFISADLSLFSGLTWIHGYSNALSLPTSPEERRTLLFQVFTWSMLHGPCYSQCSFYISCPPNLSFAPSALNLWACSPHKLTSDLFLLGSTLL